MFKQIFSVVLLPLWLGATVKANPSTVLGTKSLKVSSASEDNLVVPRSSKQLPRLSESASQPFLYYLPQVNPDNDATALANRRLQQYRLKVQESEQTPLYRTAQLQQTLKEITPPRQPAPKLSQLAKAFVSATTVLKSLSIYDITFVRASTFARLPPAALETAKDISKRLPDPIKKNVGRYHANIVERSVGDLLNELPTSTLSKFGARWIEILGNLPARSWAVLLPSVIRHIPWQAIISNLNINLWKEIPFQAVNKFPCEFFWYSPQTVLDSLHPGVWSKLRPEVFHGCIRNLNSLPWTTIAPYLDDSTIFNGMDRIQLAIVPWHQIVPFLRPTVFIQLRREALLAMGPITFGNLVAGQIQAIRPSIFSSLPYNYLQAISKTRFRSLSRGFLEAIDKRLLVALLV